MDNLSFNPVAGEHRELVRTWLHKEHVRPYFYGQGLENTLKNLDLFVKGIDHNGLYRFKYWIARAADKPFAFLITSEVEGPYDPKDDYAKWYEEGRQTITLDLLIGEEEFLGKGLAAPLIREFLLTMFPHASIVLIDPEATNSRAIHVYERAGFEKLEQFIPAYNPVPHWMMRLKIPHNYM